MLPRGLDSVTVAPGSTAPDESVMVPPIAPTPCATAGRGEHAHNATATMILTKRDAAMAIPLNRAPFRCDGSGRARAYTRDVRPAEDSSRLENVFDCLDCRGLPCAYSTGRQCGQQFIHARRGKARAAELLKKTCCVRCELLSWPFCRRSRLGCLLKRYSSCTFQRDPCMGQSIQSLTNSRLPGDSHLLPADRHCRNVLVSVKSRRRESRLLRSERHHRIDGRRPACGHVARRGGDAEEHDAHAAEDGGVVQRHAEPE